VTTDTTEKFSNLSGGERTVTNFTDGRTKLLVSDGNGDFVAGLGEVSGQKSMKKLVDDTLRNTVDTVQSNLCGREGSEDLQFEKLLEFRGISEGVLVFLTLLSDFITEKALEKAETSGSLEKKKEIVVSHVCFSFSGRKVRW